MRDADFIVVGGGAAGAVMAARLSEDPDTNVLLLEAGGRARGPLFSVPLMTGLLLRGGVANWGYATEPEAHLDGRRLKWPRGKALGGSTAINGMVWRRGLPLDFDLWAQAGLRGWSWREVAPAFEKAERRQPGAGTSLGQAGPLPVSRGQLDNPLYDAWIAAALALGYPATDDFNGEAGHGVGRYDFSIHKGQRMSSARAYLNPAMNRANLQVQTRMRVLRLLIERGRCIGVEAHDGNEVLRLYARREVILSGGAINSPQLLMLSGIGPADALRQHGVAPRVDLPGVGASLQDHLMVRVEFRALEAVTLDRLRRIDTAALAFLRAVTFGTGPAASFPLEAGGLLKSEPGLDAPDLQTSIMPALSAASMRLPGLGRQLAPDRGNGFFSNIFQMRPNSRGHITLASADPMAPPLIYPNYLSAPPDRAVLRRGVKMLREIYAHSAFDKYRGEELSPGPDVTSDHDIDRWISASADTVFHPTSTCRMGPDNDPGAVVDDRLRIRGVDGLRVVDASVMPAVTSGNTAAPTIMIAEQAARFIRDAPSI